MGDSFSIGQMAGISDCKVPTIRYYEKIGILPLTQRTDGNQRIYDHTHLDRLKFIRHSRELGFSLDRIREILALRDTPTHSCEDVNQIALSHLQEVESKIERLKDMEKELKRMILQCAGGQVATCRIIEVLSNHNLCISDNQEKIKKDL